VREELEGIIWPLFVFILLKNALSLGVIGTLASIGSIAFTLIVGKYTDRLNPKIFMRIGAVAMAGIWIARTIAPQSLPLVYLSTLVSGFLACLILVPFSSYIYGTAKRNTPAEFLVYREIPVTLARIVTYSIAIVVASMTLLFPIGAIASALILLF
jgi:hypothetical protein